MRTTWHQIWGSARGPALILAPPTRIVTGGALFLACTLAPATSRAGLLLIALCLTGWVAACQPPRRIFGGALLVGVVLLAPYFLLTPLIAGAGGTPLGFTERLLVPWRIFAHGLAGLLIAVTSVTTLTAMDLREGLLRLPLPRLVAAILLQIVHQTGELFYETRRIGAAMAVRGAVRGNTATLRLCASLPRVWLPRVMLRAERVAAAMALRGYGAAQEHILTRTPFSRWDALAWLAGAAALGSALTLRVLGAR